MSHIDLRCLLLYVHALMLGFPHMANDLVCKSPIFYIGGLESLVAQCSLLGARRLYFGCPDSITRSQFLRPGLMINKDPTWGRSGFSALWKGRPGWSGFKEGFRNRVSLFNNVYTYA